MSRKTNKRIKKEQKKAQRKKAVNKDIYRISAVFAVIFAALCAYLVYFMVFQADSVINNSYNKRTEVLSESTLRGQILSADGEVLAYSVTDSDGNDTRIYPYGSEFAHVVGFADNGGMGIESAYNYYLLTSHTNLFNQLYSEFTGDKAAGDNVVTTLDVGLQEEIYDLLGDNEGAVVVMDPETGDILAMVSSPTFDPNTVSENWDTISADSENSVLYNRATQSAMTPGSTFKIFTLLEYYRENNGNVDGYSYSCSGSFTSSDGITLSCSNGRSHGSVDIISSFAYSCNSSFANIGLSLDLTSFKENNEALLFNSELPLDIAYTESSFTLDEDSSTFMIMQTAIGQGETTITPIHLALITCAIANDGVLMTPRLVSEVQTAGGSTVASFETSEYASLLTSDEAAFLKEAMRAVVTEGTASAMASASSYTAYGKTGTADTSSDEDSNYSHSWFTGFAESNGNTIVVCVMIENTQSSGLTGEYVARQVFNYYFSR